MRKYQLRTYHLNSERAATEYLPHWIRHVQSLGTFGVQTHAFFSSQSDPAAVIALISFEEEADPETVTAEYMRSEAFQDDMSGFDVNRIVKVDTVNLVPGDGSPLT